MSGTVQTLLTERHYTTDSVWCCMDAGVKMIDGAGLSEMLLTYPNSTGSGYAVSSNTRNEGM
jgi:hypothetical protein